MSEPQLDAQTPQHNPSRADAFVCIAARPRGTIAPHVPVLLLSIDDKPQWTTIARAFIERHARSYGVRVAAVCCLPDDDPDQQAVLHVLSEHQAGAAIGQHTLELRAEEWGRNFIANLAEPACVLQQLARPLVGATTIVVAAGPSLDHVGPHLRDYQQQGAFIIAVNTAVPACLAYGCVPDLVCSAEAKPEVAQHMHELPAHVPLALDAFASPASWSLPNPKFRCFGHEPNIVPYALKLGARPCSYTGTVTSMAIAVAADLGSTTIALAGFDCGYGPDGAVYAKHTPFEGLRASECEDGLIRFDGSTAKQRGPVPAVRADGTRFAGCDVLTEHALIGFGEWVAKAASRRVILSLGSRGVGIPFVAELEADQLSPFIHGKATLDELPAPIPKLVVEGMLDALEADAREKLADPAAIYPSPGVPLLNLWIVPRMLHVSRTAGSPGDRVRMIRSALATGCEQIIEAVSKARERLASTFPSN